MEISRKVITLPSTSTITRRLRKLKFGPRDYYAERFYPLVAKEAGRQQLTAEGVYLLLVFKIQAFNRPGMSIMTEGLLRHLPEIIGALLDDKEVAEEAKRWHQEMLDTTTY